MCVYIYIYKYIFISIFISLCYKCSNLFTGKGIVLLKHYCYRRDKKSLFEEHQRCVVMRTVNNNLLPVCFSPETVTDINPLLPSGQYYIIQFKIRTYF